MCCHTHTPLTTQNCTTLQPSTSTHTYTLTKTHIHFKTKTQNTHAHKERIHALGISLPAGFTILLYVNCFSFFYPDCYLCIVLYCMFVYLSIYLIRVYVYMYCCCFRYLNGVCPIRDGHCGHHQQAPAQWFPLCGRVMIMVTTTSSSSFVPELLYCFLSVTKDCIRLNCRWYCCQQFSTVADG